MAEKHHQVPHQRGRGRGAVSPGEIRSAYGQRGGSVPQRGGGGEGADASATLQSQVRSSDAARLRAFLHKTILVLGRSLHSLPEAWLSGEAVGNPVLPRALADALVAFERLAIGAVEYDERARRFGSAETLTLPLNELKGHLQRLRALAVQSRPIAGTQVQLHFEGARAALMVMTNVLGPMKAEGSVPSASASQGTGMQSAVPPIGRHAAAGTAQAPVAARPAALLQTKEREKEMAPTWELDLPKVKPPQVRMTLPRGARKEMFEVMDSKPVPKFDHFTPPSSVSDLTKEMGVKEHGKDARAAIDEQKECGSAPEARAAGAGDVMRQAFAQGIVRTQWERCGGEDGALSPRGGADRSPSMLIGARGAAATRGTTHDDAAVSEGDERREAVDGNSPDGGDVDIEGEDDGEDVPEIVKVANGTTRMANKLLSMVKVPNAELSVVGKAANDTVGSLAALEKLLRVHQQAEAAEDLRNIGMRYVSAAKMCCVLQRDSVSFREMEKLRWDLKHSTQAALSGIGVDDGWSLSPRYSMYERTGRKKKMTLKRGRRITRSAKENRDLAIAEIIDTERTYYANLDTIIVNFKRPMKALAQGGCDFVSESEVDAMFSNIESLLAISHQLLGELENLDQSKRTIGEVFLEICPMMKLYTQYINDFDQSMEAQSACGRRTEFDKYVKGIIESLGETLSLGSYLIMPVQRLPRYEMLLNALLKFTKAVHPDYELLKEAAGKMKAINDLVNDRKRQAEARSYIVQLKQRIVNAPASFVLVQPQRVLIREGPIVRVIKSKKSTFRSVNIYVYLFSDLLLVTKPKSNAVKYLDSISLMLPTELHVERTDDQEFRVWDSSRVEPYLSKKESAAKVDANLDARDQLAAVLAKSPLRASPIAEDGGPLSPAGQSSRRSDVSFLFDEVWGGVTADDVEGWVMALEGAVSAANKRERSSTAADL